MKCKECSYCHLVRGFKMIEDATGEIVPASHFCDYHHIIVIGEEDAGPCPMNKDTDVSKCEYMPYDIQQKAKAKKED